MVKIGIYIRSEGSDEWIRGLEISLEDIERLSLRPLKWLRFVAFAVLGAKGNLFDAPGPERNIVNYDTVSVTDLADRYYFFSDGCYHLVDSSGLADCITSSASTPRRSTFRHDVAQRDNNRCVITETPGFRCHAAHIIPHSKGDQYIRLVISDRRSLYEDQQVYLRNDLEIDSTENGMLLTPDLHGRFGDGASACLKTPNFALDPDDIPRVELGEPPASRITFQHFEPWEGLYPIPQLDVRLDWAVQDTPPSILLDYMYGVAVIKRWATVDIRNLLKERQETYYKIANTPSSIPEDVEPGDPTVTDCVLPRNVRRRGIHQTRTELAQCDAIDTAFAFSLFFRGYPPGTTIDMILQKQEEEAEMRSRRVAKEKVQGWLGMAD